MMQLAKQFPENSVYSDCVVKKKQFQSGWQRNDWGVSVLKSTRKKNVVIRPIAPEARLWSVQDARGITCFQFQPPPSQAQMGLLSLEWMMIPWMLSRCSHEMSQCLVPPQSYQQVGIPE
jgi:hypothetical protein